MSHIVSFRIEGLAGRQVPLECELNRDTNVFFGPNGSGKTSLLKILHAAMANETDLLGRVPFTSAEVRIYSASWDKVFTRSIEKTRLAIQPRSKRVRATEILTDNDGVIHEGSIRRDNLQWDCKPASPKEVSATRWRHEYLPTSRLHVSDEAYLPHHESPRSRTWLTEEQLDVVFARSVERLWGRYSSQMLGAVRIAQEQGLASILKTVLSPESARSRRGDSRLTSSTAYERVRNFLVRQGSASIMGSRKAFENRYEAEPTLQDVVRDIDEVESRIEAAMASRDSLQELISKMFTANKEIRFTDESIEVSTLSGEGIGLTSLSSGEKHLLQILVQVLLVRESLLMIDEPELSMHVDWQKELIHSLRTLNSEAQLVLATHSPEIMADIPDKSIFPI